ncbi:MAG: HEAT repeat domain-containing protein [Candidatus Hydrogenedens sp.]|jgi:hypothetical protein|nr:HEAT repeat domain-containing protein [Candidatus Hydrogenedens sp.]
MKYSFFVSMPVLVLLLLCLSLLPAEADTIILKNNVRIHGKIEKEVGEFMHVRVDTRSIRVRRDEILQVEENDLDGSFDLERAVEAAKEEDEKLTEELGLDSEQRDRVYRLVSLLSAPDVAKSREARNNLLAMQKELNIIPYIVFMLPSYLPPVVLSLLEFMTEVSPDQAQPVLQEYVFFTDENVRAKCLDLLGIIRDKSSIELMMRGLLDHTGIVKISACKALAQIKAREATPLLAHYFDQSDLRVQNNVRQALSALWSDGENAVSFDSQQEWLNFWQEKNASVEKTVLLELLEPLVEEGTHFSGC